VAGLLLLALALLRFAFQADEDGSWFLGQPFGSACWFRLRFGVPCPNCGMTRSLILAAHGEWIRSLRVAPGGAAAVAMAILDSAVLALLGGMMLWAGSAAIEKARDVARKAVLAGVFLTGGVWFGGWSVALLRSLSRG